ncbi:hypothetical protein MK489_08805 [Myxococcota bacterium]|nr:hypothetical protein [Myxococcota bacterium]
MSSPTQTRRACWLLGVALWGFWVASTLEFLGSERLPTSPSPEAPKAIAFDDYALQYYYGLLGSGFLAEAGSTWGYDPNFMAGYVKMPLYYPSSKIYEVSLLVLVRGLGIHPATAFNMTVFVLLLSLPLLAWWAARLWGLSPLEQTWVTAFAVAPNLFVPIAGYYSIMEAAGMVPFVFAASLSLVVIAAARRFALEGGGSAFLQLVGLTAVLFLCHLTAGVLLIAPLVVLYFTRFRQLRPQIHLGLWAVIGTTLALNGFWLEGLLRYGHYAEMSDFYSEGGRDHFAPAGGWLAPLRVTVPTPAAISLLPPVLGTLGLVLWAREGRRDLAQLFGAQIVFLFALAFYGEPLGLSAVGPARITLPLGLTLFFPAAHSLAVAGRASVAWLHPRLPIGSRVTRPRWATVGVAGALLAAGIALGLPQRVWRPYSIPELQNRNQTEHLGHGLIRWLGQRADTRGRLLHEETDRLSHRYYGAHLPALIPMKTGIPLAGGPAPHALLTHNHLRFIAGTFRGRRLGQTPFDEMSEYMTAYNVRWVLAWSPVGKRYFERHPHVTTVGSFDKFQLFRVDDEPNWFSRGRGVLTVSPNHIELREVVPERGAITLKFHWLESLRTDPPREIVPVHQLEDPVPFISVLDPPEDFVIYNDYDAS